MCNLKDLPAVFLNRYAIMSLNTPKILAEPFGSPQDRLEYLLDMIRQLQSLSAADFPTVSAHLKAAGDEAGRLEGLRTRR